MRRSALSSLNPNAPALGSAPRVGGVKDRVAARSRATTTSCASIPSTTANPLSNLSALRGSLEAISTTAAPSWGAANWAMEAEDDELASIFDTAQAAIDMPVSIAALESGGCGGGPSRERSRSATPMFGAHHAAAAAWNGGGDGAATPMFGSPSPRVRARSAPGYGAPFIGDVSRARSPLPLRPSEVF